MLSNEALLTGARVISECTELPELLEKLAPLMLRASEAQRFVLLLPDMNGIWNVRVVATADETQLLEQPLRGSQHLPVELIESVSGNPKTWTDIDSGKSEFSSVYFDQFAIKSALCLPLICQSNTVGAAYFEHRTLENLFHQDRIGALEFLSMQAAVLIENKYLSEALERQFQVPNAHEPDFFTEHLPGCRFRARITSDDVMSVLFVSKNCEVIYEVSAESFKSGQYTFTDFVHKEDRELMARERRALSFAEAKYIECRIVTPSGLVKWIGITRRVISHGHDGSIIYDGITLDITARKSAELELLNTQAQLRTVTNNMPGMVFRYLVSADGNKTVLYLSHQVRDLFELEVEDVRSDIDLVNTRIHPDDVDMIKSQLAQLRPSAHAAGPIQLEYRVILPRQGLRWRQSVRQASRTENGDTIWDGVVIDVTDRNEAQTQLQRITENIPGMVYQINYGADGKQSSVEFVNSKSRELFGVEPTDLVQDGAPVSKEIHPHDITALRKSVHSSVTTLTPFTNQYRVIHPEHGLRWHQTNGHPEQCADSNNISLTGVTFDITDQKNAEHTLLEAETKLQRITENIPGMVYRFVLGKDGSRQIVYASSKVRELFELEPDIAINDAEKVFTRIHWEDQKLVETALSQSIVDLTPISLEHRVVLPRQGQKWLKTSVQPFRDDNGDYVFDGVVVDITLHKEAELHLQKANVALARATKMKDEFLANMSHELRTPLTAILASAEGLQHGIFGKISEQQTECATVITESGKHLLDLINEILDLAKIESGSTELNISQIDITPLCQSSLQLVNPQAKEKNIKIKLSLPADLPPLQADEKRVRQILVNLLDNAVKFTTNSGHVQLRVEQVFRVNNTSGKMVRFIVDDTGSGIEKSKLESLFEPFMQVQTSLNREYRGTGLGLAMVKQLAELHGGMVSVTSRLGVGSRFTVDLPLTAEGYTTKPPDPYSEPAKKATPATNPGKDDLPLVLMAEDNESVGVTTQRYLEMENFRVHWVHDGDEAIKAAVALEPDLILMDIQMPRVDGLHAIKELRKVNALEDTPVIALTGLAMQDDEHLCLAAGANHYLSKPYRMQNLVNLMQRLLEYEKV